MRPIRDVFVKVGEPYKSSITTEGGFKILLDTNLVQVKDTVRYGEVVGVPEKCPLDIKEGDVLFFHHSIVAYTRMSDQPDMDSPYLVDRDKKIYRVPVDNRWPMLYAVARDGEFMCLDGVCFVRPIKVKKIESSLYIPNNETEVQNIGTLVYGNKSLKESGISEGDGVVFEKDSEYKFEINGEVLYRMFNRWILGKYEG